MQTFKKLLVGSLVFLVVVSSVSILFIRSYNSIIDDTTIDHDYRQYAGKIDTLFIGSSNTRVSLDTEMYDRAMNTSSYSYTSNRIYMPYIYYSLKKVIAENELKTVFVELSYDNLFDEPKDVVESVLNYYDLLPSDIEKLAFTLSHAGPENAMKAYGYTMNNGAKHLIQKTIHNAYLFYKYICTGDKYAESETKKAENTITRGFLPEREKVFDISKDRYFQDYHSESHPNAVVNAGQFRYLKRIIDLCKSHGIDLRLIVYPVSNYYTILFDNNSIFENACEMIRREFGLQIFDFNLISNKSSVFSDKVDFYNRDHLSFSGAEKLTGILIDTLKNPETVSFLSTYSSLEKTIMDSVGLL